MIVDPVSAAACRCRYFADRSGPDLSTQGLTRGGDRSRRSPTSCSSGSARPRAGKAGVFWKHGAVPVRRGSTPTGLHNPRCYPYYMAPVSRCETTPQKSTQWTRGTGSCSIGTREQERSPVAYEKKAARRDRFPSPASYSSCHPRPVTPGRFPPSETCGADPLPGPPGEGFRGPHTTPTKNDSMSFIPPRTRPCAYSL